MLVRVVWIPKYCIRISPQILTTDPRPHLQADAVSYLLSVCDSALNHVRHCPSMLLGTTLIYRQPLHLHSTFTVLLRSSCFRSKV